MGSNNSVQSNVRDGRKVFCWVVFISLFFTACPQDKPPKPFTIGIVNYVSILNPVIEGFKAGMNELGYTEGKDVIYIDNGVVLPDSQTVDAEIKQLLAHDIDLLFPIGTLATLRAKHAVEGRKMAVVFGAVPRPVEEGIVESISNPGGSLTGVQVGTQMSKALEWLLTIVPEADRVYVPYNPDDEVSRSFLARLDDAASQMGIELMLDEVHSVEDTVAAIQSLPGDVNAIFRIPSPTLDSRNDELSQAAIARGLPMGASLPLDEAILFTLAVDLFDVGKQTARLAHQIRQGEKPADLPVETSEFFLIINLKTADAIGLDIPDDILLQADTIIR